MDPASSEAWASSRWVKRSLTASAFESLVIGLTPFPRDAAKPPHKGQHQECRQRGQ